MKYQSQKIKIEGTNAYDISRALAYLARFRNYQATTRQSPREGAGCEGIVFHRETVAKDPDLFLATQSPDIIVTAFLRDEYLVEFNERVDESLVGDLEKELGRVYAEVH